MDSAAASQDGLFSWKIMERETIHKPQDVPSGINTYFLERGYDYVEYLGDFMNYKVYRARFYNDYVIAPWPVILAKDHKFRECRPGYEVHIVFDYLEKEQDNYTMWRLLAIRIRLFFDHILCVVMALIIPDPNYGLFKKIEIILSGVWESY